jgi:metal-responsive CopG/Arc/MetJ family transcriptional regulator
MYDKEALMRSRKLVTISLPPALLREAERVAREENRTKSELLRESLRFYVETRDLRKAAARDRLFDLIDSVQERAAEASPLEIRSLVRDAVAAARKG